MALLVGRDSGKEVETMLEDYPIMCILDDLDRKEIIDVWGEKEIHFLYKA